MKTSQAIARTSVIIMVVVIVLAGMGLGAYYSSVPSSKPSASTTIPTAATSTSLGEEAALYEAARKEGVVNVYSSNIIPLLDNISYTFTARYPGVKVQYQRVVGAFPKIQAEQVSKNYWADVDVESMPLIVPTSVAGYLETYRPPNARTLPSDYMDKDGTWYASQLLMTVLAYNTRNVKPDQAPKSWMDLCNPMWVGRLGLPDLVSFDWGIQWLSSMKQHLGDKWPQWIGCIRNLKPVYFATWTPIAQGIAIGQVDIGITLTSSVSDQILAKQPIAVDIAAAPVVVTFGANAIVKNAPHPNAARLFLNWMLSNEAQQLQAKVGGYITPAGHSPDWFLDLAKVPRTVLDAYMTPRQIATFRNELGLPW